MLPNTPTKISFTVATMDPVAAASVDHQSGPSRVHLDTAAKPGALTCLSAAALEVNKRVDCSMTMSRAARRIRAAQYFEYSSGSFS